jgi:hypothetical protein
MRKEEKMMKHVVHLLMNILLCFQLPLIHPSPKKISFGGRPLPPNNGKTI